MRPDSQSPQAYFGLILQTVVGQAFNAAGYQLEDRPAQQRAGLFRYVKPLTPPLFGVIEFQVLAYTDTEHSSGMPSRFRVMLIRTDQANAALTSRHPQAVRRDLSALVTLDFGVQIVPSSAYWWPYRDTTELGKALGEAGHLVVGFGLPWLNGDLPLP